MLLRDTNAASSRIERLLASNAAIEWHPVAEQTQPPLWYRDNRVLVGDAAHPLLPFGGQDFALAVEDAWVLSRMLDMFDDHVSTALSEYQRYRQPRARQMQTHLVNQAIWHSERGPLRRLANSWSFAMKYRLMPEIAMQRDDWQFEYDCIKGFH
jgi:salicylate hydroxylase